MNLPSARWSVVAFAADGSVLLASMDEGKGGPRILPGGLYLSRKSLIGPGSWRSAQAFPNGLDSALNAPFVLDKPVMIVDHSPQSPYLGSV